MKKSDKKAVIIGTISYAMFVNCLRHFRNELKLIHIKNIDLPDTHIVSANRYDGILVCNADEVILAKECIRQANEYAANEKFNLNIVEYDEPKIFDLLPCSNSNKYSVSGYVKDCVKSKENCQQTFS